MGRIKRALISVWDKKGIVEFARELASLKVKILSTGGTKKLLEKNNIRVTSVSSYTGFPEMMDGRLKTLHPKIHGGLLAKRNNPKHLKEAKAQQIDMIDLVVVNLYPFKEVIQKKNVNLEEAIENIDIGGPTMLRSAAKNFEDVAVVTNPSWYPEIIKELKKNKGALTKETKAKLALEVFELTSDYDAAIKDYLKKTKTEEKAQKKEFSLTDKLILEFEKLQELRYGENPHQVGAFYKDMQSREAGLSQLKQLQGKELSFNNIMDLDAAVAVVSAFKEPAAVIIKHNNPCGVASAKSSKRAFLDAWECDSLSAFGSIIGLNRQVDKELATSILDAGFVECIIAPGFNKDTLPLFAKKKKLRLIECRLPLKKNSKQMDFKKVWGGLLIQNKDIEELGELKVVTKVKPTKEQLASLVFAWKIVKFVKSNAIVLAKGTKTVGIGAGQMSRVDSVVIAHHKAGSKAKGSCLASDAFFPKPDSIEEAAKAGVVAIIQPGGSRADEEIVRACDKNKIAMVFTELRHFKH